MICVLRSFMVNLKGGCFQCNANYNVSPISRAHMSGYKIWDLNKVIIIIIVTITIIIIIIINSSFVVILFIKWNKTVCEKYLKSRFIFITNGSILTAISFRNLERSWERLIKANKRGIRELRSLETWHWIIFIAEVRKWPVLYCFIRMYANWSIAALFVRGEWMSWKATTARRLYLFDQPRS